MAAKQSVMFSSTWQILQHYRESGIYDLSEKEDDAYPSYSPLRSTAHERNISLETVSTMRSHDSEQNSPASSLSSQGSFLTYHKELRRRRTRSGEPRATDLTLTKSNGSTQLDHKNLPQTKYFTRRPTYDSDDLSPPPPPPPPKNARRNSYKPYPSLQDLAREEVARVTNGGARSERSPRIKSPPSLKVAVPGTDKPLVPPPRLDSLASNPNFPSPQNHGLRRPATTKADLPADNKLSFPKRKDSLSSVVSNDTFVVGMSVSDMLAGGLRSPSVYGDSPGPPLSSVRSPPPQKSIYPAPLSVRGTPVFGSGAARDSRDNRPQYPRHKSSLSTGTLNHPIPPVSANLAGPFQQPEFYPNQPSYQPASRMNRNSVFSPVSPIHKHQRNRSADQYHSRSRSDQGPQRQDSGVSDLTPDSPVSKQQPFSINPNPKKGFSDLNSNKMILKPLEEEKAYSPPPPPPPPKTGLPANPRPNRVNNNVGAGKGKEKESTDPLQPPRFPTQRGPATPVSAKPVSAKPLGPPPKQFPGQLPRTPDSARYNALEVNKRVEQNRVEPKRVKQNWTEQNWVEQNRVEPKRVEQNRMEQNRMEQNRMEQNRMEQNRMESNRMESNNRFESNNSYEPLEPPPTNRYGSSSRPGTPDSMRQPHSAASHPRAASAPAITGAHLTCYSGHRSQSASNTVAPVRCMSCWANMNRTWTCSGCNLRICTACRGRLGEARGDLGAVLRKVEGERGRNMDDNDNNHLSVRSASAGRQRSGTNGSGSSAASGNSRLSHTSGSSASSVQSLPVGASALSHLSRGLTPPPPHFKSSPPSAPPNLRGEGAYPSYNYGPDYNRGRSQERPRMDPSYGMGPPRNRYQGPPFPPRGVDSPGMRGREFGPPPRTNRYPPPRRGRGYSDGDSDDEGGRGYGDMSTNLYPDMGAGPYQGVAAKFGGAMPVGRVR